MMDLERIRGDWTRAKLKDRKRVRKVVRVPVLPGQRVLHQAFLTRAERLHRWEDETAQRIFKIGREVE